VIWDNHDNGDGVDDDVIAACRPAGRLGAFNATGAFQLQNETYGVN
jgi:hypothetical protein